MLLLITLIIIIVFLLMVYTYRIQLSYRNMPPGPLVIPILGNAPALWLRKPTLNVAQVRPWEYLDLLSKEFGDLFTFSALGFDLVTIASYELLEDVAHLEEYSAKFAHKYCTYPRTFGKELGLMFVYTPTIWKEMRKFTVRTLRDFGFGKLYTMHSVITSEVEELIKEFHTSMAKNNGIVKFRNTFSLSVLNVLWCMVAGTRYEHDDPRLVKLLESTYQLSKCATFANPMEFIVPLAHKVAPGLLKGNMRYKVFDEIHELTKMLVEERKSVGAYLTDPQNYIDVFLKKMHSCKVGEETIYTEQQLQSMIADLLLVGSLTLNGTLSYGILFLVLHPEIQKRCQEEIDSIVAPHMAPTIEDVEKMPYFQAFLLEMHRCANVVPNPIPRIAPKDWNLRGYKIPKGTIIISNHFTINNDNNIWGDANAFRPERFLNEKGEFVPDPRVVVFGFGKRICIGIHLVNSIIPLFLSTLLQKFTFSIPPGTKPPTTVPEIGVSLSPQEFLVQLSNRTRHQ